MNEQSQAHGPSSQPEGALVRCLKGHCGLTIACLLTAIFAAVAFVPSMDNAFVYDDHAIIEQNPAVNTRLPGASIPWYRIWLEPYWPPYQSVDKLYRPLTSLSLRVNANFAGEPMDARRFRWVNVGLHMLTSIAVVMLGWRLTGSAAAAGLAGILFASHPIHTEAVVPIYGRSELLAGCLGAWLVARHLRLAQADRPPAVREWLVSAFLLLAATMSKEHAIFVWPGLLAIDLWRRFDTQAAASRLSRRDWFNQYLGPAHFGYALAAATFLFFRYLVFGWKTHLEADRTRIYEVPMAHVGLLEHVLTPFRLLWLVVRNLLFTESLCPIWSYPALSPANGLYGDVLAGMALAIVLAVLIAVLWTRRHLAGGLLLGLVFTLLIPIQAIPVARWFYAERWLYLPTVFVAVLVAAGVRRWGRAAAVGGLAASFLLLPQTWQYGAKFADDLTMHREVILRQPNNFQGRRNYASVLYHQGQYREAIQAANQLLERLPNVKDAYQTLLLSYLELGDGWRALDAIEKYEHLTAGSGAPSLARERERASALIEQQRSGPTASAPTKS